MTTRELLYQATDVIADFVESLPNRRVGPTATTDELAALLGGPVPEDGTVPEKVIAELAEQAEGGLMTSTGPRFFGFVIGGSLPAALAADLLTSAWDQNGGLIASTPAGAVIDDVSGRWVIDLLGLPRDASFAFTTGGMMANFTCLAAGRHHVLQRAGWDVEAEGLQGAPPVTIVVGGERHVTVDASLRLLGFGPRRFVVVPVDGQGRMKADELAGALDEITGPTIVVAQAGNVNTGATDPLRAICNTAHQQEAWVHVDGAFGLWAAASPRRKHLLDGFELADSWSTDAHKWLNVPYDCGVSITAHPGAHRAAMSVAASYLIQSVAGAKRDPMDWTPEFSRRARCIPVYAAIRSLGRSGVADLIERCCQHASRFAEILGSEDGVEVLNDVELNQVLVRFGDDDAITEEVVRKVQEDGTMWLSGARWQGRGIMRISVSNWSTSDSDVERSAKAILRCFHSVR